MFATIAHIARRRLGSLIGLLGVALAIGCTPERPGPKEAPKEGPIVSSSLPPEEVASIREVHDAYPTAWLENDVEGVMKLFTEDAVLIPHRGASDVVGRTAIREFFWPPSSPEVTVSAYDMSVREIEGEGDIAFARGRFELDLELEEEGERRLLSNSGSYLMVLQKSSAGDWRIARYMWSDPASQAH